MGDLTKAVKAAIESHTTLCLFAAAAEILESSDIRGHRAQGAAGRAVSLLRKEMGYLVRDHDKALSALNDEGKGR